MDTKEINAKLSALVVKMLTKAIVQPDVTIVWSANEEPHVMLYETKSSAYVKDVIYYGAGDTLADRFDDAERWIDTLPSPEEKRMKDFMKSLAAAIELGRANGIDVEFVNPLQATMKKLSDNILTDQRAVR